MIAIGDVALLRPAALLLLPALAAAGLLLRPRGGLGDWRRAIDAPLFSALTSLGAVSGDDGGGRRVDALLAALAIVAVALAGPAVRRPGTEAWRNLDGMVLAVDVSRSTTAGGGLAEGRFAAQALAAAAGARQTALVVYAGDAYLAESFTADSAALGQLIAALGPDIVPDGGSDPARALALAGERLAAAGIPAGDVVLIGDGGGIGDAAIAAAAKLAAAGHRVHAVTTPGTAPGGGPAPDGRAAATRLAAAGGGTTADAADPAPVAAVVGAAAASRLAASDFVPLGWFDLGRPLLVLAGLLLLVAAFRRRA
ncbi:VWA domain-containing protein [Oharaeibacter diazotrophicus]|uniref:Ca-activated chloride channel family protein n=1 Tax=Oharaeibacter diazotrophicus TaxID=1920512 RepID=A0A4R6RJY9_9HYPH|nr:VWA domain-containing protein [Oharaeibacter diazotrophicus]TDP86227.1 Ca-activated chloride channel family protein [Oharaeibacter diazotrophicus]BBE71831.1 hypothetical protein OHA_1_01416 [Pleomorphomonas sp. SM30]GLS78596.1 hypothetical protein GCM10007904_39330 [Oharaeibacter diazotrophicus]